MLIKVLILVVVMCVKYDTSSNNVSLRHIQNISLFRDSILLFYINIYISNTAPNVFIM